MSDSKIEEVGHIEKGNGKHQSNVVYGIGGGITDRLCRNRHQVLDSDFRYGLCDKISYCIDSNYWKGTTFKQYLEKHRRQLIIERY